MDYSASGTQFNGYTQGPGYYGKTFFLWPPDPRNTTTPELQHSQELPHLDRHYQHDGPDVSRQQLEHLAGPGHNHRPGQPAKLADGEHDERRAVHSDSSKFVPGSSNNAPIYYAVCRLFNRAYPAGSSNGQFSADWRMRFFGTNSNTHPVQHFRVIGYARKLHVHDQLQRDPALDRPDAEPLPDADARRPHQVLRIDPDRDHRDLAQLRQHRPAILGRVHRPCARLQANGGGRVLRTSAPRPATAAISPGGP